MERTTSWDQGQKNRAFENASEQHHREVQESMTDGRTLLDIIDEHATPKIDRVKAKLEKPFQHENGAAKRDADAESTISTRPLIQKGGKSEK